MRGAGCEVRGAGCASGHEDAIEQPFERFVSRVSRWFSSATRACSLFMRSIMLTSSFTFSSSRSSGSISTLLVAVFGMPSPSLRGLALYGAVLVRERGVNPVEALLHFCVGQR